jgi:putative oxidoreductase
MNIKTCFQPKPVATSVSLALLILRIIVGIAFVYHGWGKIQNPFAWMPNSAIPGIFQFLAALSEFGGGIALILGFVTPVASLGLACTMLVATYFHAVLRGDPFVNMTGGGSFEPALVYVAISLVLLAIGPGQFSLDSLIFKNRKQ